MAHHHTCCTQKIVKKGFWSPDEDEKLRNYINKNGHDCWSTIPKLAGLERCGKSCRLRWINYLRPDLKREEFTVKEIRLLVELHETLGNRWSQIAKYMPGRTDNEIKNFCNLSFMKKLLVHYKVRGNKSTIKSPANITNNYSFSHGTCFNSTNNSHNNLIYYPNAPMRPQMSIPNINLMSSQGSTPFVPHTTRVDSMMIYNTDLASPPVQIANNYSISMPNDNLLSWSNQYSYTPKLVNQVHSQAFMHNDNSLFGEFKSFMKSNFQFQSQTYSMQQEHMILPPDNDILFGFDNPNNTNSLMNSNVQDRAYNRDEPSITYFDKSTSIDLDMPFEHFFDGPIDNEFSISSAEEGVSCTNAPMYSNSINHIDLLMKSSELTTPSMTEAFASTTVATTSLPVDSVNAPLPWSEPFTWESNSP